MRNAFFSKIISIKIGDDQEEPEIEVSIESTIGRSDYEILTTVIAEFESIYGLSRYINENREKKEGGK